MINTIVNGLLQNCESYQVDADVDIDSLSEFHYGTEGVKWKEWKTVGINLSNYAIGDEIVFEFINYDCAHGGHFGYTYLVAGHKEEAITYEACADDSKYYLFAPLGFTYLWNTGQTSQYITLNDPSPGTVYTCELTQTIDNVICDVVVGEITIKDYDCCKVEDQGIDLTPLGVAGNLGYSTSLPSLVSNQTFYINGTFYVVDYLELFECIVNFGPNGKIIVEPDVTFSDKQNSIFQPCNQSYMWDGIYDSETTEETKSISKFNGSKFISAKSALNFQKFNQIWVHDAEFNNCYTALELNDYLLDLDNYPSNTVTFTETDVQGGPLNETYLDATNSTNGIKINNCENIYIGHSENALGTWSYDPSNLNEFTNLRTGINNFNSSLYLKYSTFYNPLFTGSRGVNSQSLASSNLKCGVNAQDCYFTDYGHVIHQYGSKAQSTFVFNCTFRNNYIGVYSRTLSISFENDGSKILCNFFYDNTYGVQMSGFNNYGGLTVSSNLFENTLKKSIWLRNIDSYIPSYSTTSYNPYGLIVMHNHVTYTNSVPSDPAGVVGISLSNCQGYSGPKLYENTLTYYARPNEDKAGRYKGIVLKDVINGSVYNNNLVAWGEGIRSVGHNELLDFKCNDFLDCYKGFRFTVDLPGSYSFISQQGISASSGNVNRPNNNYFYGQVEERFSGELSMPLDINWFSNPGWLTNIYLEPSLYGFIIPVYTQYGSGCSSYEPKPSLGGIDLGADEDFSNDLIPDTVGTAAKVASLLNYSENYMGSNEADNSQYRNKYLYSLVAQKLEAQEPGETQLLNNLHQVLLESNLAKMVGIEKHISAKEFGQALALTKALFAII